MTLFRSVRFAVCLFVVAGLAACSGGAAPKSAASASAGLTGSYVLALNWEPAFCETRPDAPECRSQTPASIDARQFSLHGLWPEEIYCGVDAKTRAADERREWEDLPPVDLPDWLRGALIVAMPGARSLLDRHEWIKHGTCTGTDQQGYYAAALALTASVNASGVPTLFANNLGNSLSAAALARAFDAAFGAGAGSRVSLECVSDGSRRLISGLRIAVSGTIGGDAGFGALVAAAGSQPARCRGGVIDPAGLQ